MGKTIRPQYYRDQDGHDLFWRMEHNQYPAAFSMGFCLLNIRKYQDRAGIKTPDTEQDLRKADTYQEEMNKLVTLYRQGKITNQGLDQYLHDTHWEHQLATMGADPHQANENVIPYPQQLTRPALGQFFAGVCPELAFADGEADDHLQVSYQDELVALIFFDRYGHYSNLVTTQARYHLDNGPYNQLVALKDTLDKYRDAYTQLQQINHERKPN